MISKTDLRRRDALHYIVYGAEQDHGKTEMNTIIFDIGNVLMTFDNRTFLHNLFQDEQTQRHVYDAIFGSGYWVELDRGREKDELLAKMIAEKPEYEQEIRTAFENAGMCMERRDYAIPWIQELKRKGYRVLYLSNYSHYAMEAKPEVLDFLPYMDGGVFSCDVFLIKPDPEIYRKLIEMYDLEPAECIFLDDMKDNVDVAKKMGMQGIVVENYSQARRELEHMLY